MEGVEYIEYSASPKLWVEDGGWGRLYSGGGYDGGGGSSRVK
jgi:hypothetical protein